MSLSTGQCCCLSSLKLVFLYFCVFVFLCFCIFIILYCSAVVYLHRMGTGRPHRRAVCMIHLCIFVFYICVSFTFFPEQFGVESVYKLRRANANAVDFGCFFLSSANGRQSSGSVHDTSAQSPVKCEFESNEWSRWWRWGGNIIGELSLALFFSFLSPVCNVHDTSAQSPVNLI